MAKSNPNAHPLPEIYDRPGFQIRRAHQNSVSVFLECLKPFDLTPTQFGALTMVRRWGPVSQIDLARSLGFDRSTTALVVRLLVERHLIARTPNPDDRRKFALTLTPAGRKLLDASQNAAEQARAALLAPFGKAEAMEFLRLLRRFNAAFDGVSRAPPVGRGRPAASLDEATYFLRGKSIKKRIVKPKSSS
ncbi:MAG: MarR family transcriptional regulator [Ferrovibrio sp.]|uniref:MarR family winged helix-turn-helix transcriptional regulator n=1 Tax=Ferrovibrio sp. TaxID=1917215 RepID=UPI0026199559|nr:MarR family transcriptional regulator [Ferrovibrio sp.]MCW0233415.1 MarR family transcriptional regulator [Ferrovibrio sp.]